MSSTYRYHHLSQYMSNCFCTYVCVAPSLIVFRTLGGVHGMFGTYADWLICITEDILPSPVFQLVNRSFSPNTAQITTELYRRLSPRFFEWRGRLYAGYMSNLTSQRIRMQYGVIFKLLKRTSCQLMGS